ncbi:MAG: hypothetical protein J6A33_01270 [Alphaproteobacteria bacterium]|nr:hypothetical protein [Alphaproteobacteria bacterium]
MTPEEFDTFDFLINDEDEVMLLLYQREGEPQNARIEIDGDNKTAVLFRNENDSIMLKEISPDVFDSLQDADKLLVCELSREENETDTQIVYAYEAEISD